MDASLGIENSHGTMDDEDLCDSVSPSYASGASDSSMSDFMDDATSSSSSSPPSSSSSPSSDRLSDGPLYQMSSLISQLPFKKGLSKHFQGKSQSFTSLANVSCLEDLVKPENPYKKKLKSSKSYGGGLDCHRTCPPKACSRAISKKASRGSCASLNAKKYSFFGSKPPIPPHRVKPGP